MRLRGLKKSGKCQRSSLENDSIERSRKMTILSNRSRSLKPSPTLAINAKAKSMQAQGIKVISFGAGEPDFDTPENIKRSAVTAIKEGFTKYTAVGGIDELKDAIIHKFQRDNQLTYKRSQVLASWPKFCLIEGMKLLFRLPIGFLIHPWFPWLKPHPSSSKPKKEMVSN
jgi:hypothetical protein